MMRGSVENIPIIANVRISGLTPTSESSPTASSAQPDDEFHENMESLIIAAVACAAMYAICASYNNYIERKLAEYREGAENYVYKHMKYPTIYTRLPDDPVKRDLNNLWVNFKKLVKIKT